MRGACCGVRDLRVVGGAWAIPGADERTGHPELGMEVGRAEGVPQWLVQADAGLGQEVRRVGELDRGALHWAQAGRRRAVTGGTEWAQAGGRACRRTHTRTRLYAYLCGDSLFLWEKHCQVAALFQCITPPQDS